MENNKEEEEGKNVWKIIAIVFISLFAVTLIGFVIAVSSAVKCNKKNCTEEIAKDLTKYAEKYHKITKAVDLNRREFSGIQDQAIELPTTS